MKYSKLNHILIAICAFTSFYANASDFKVVSNDIKHGYFMSKDHEFKGFGCNGDNLSPHLTWSNPPKGTKGFAVMAYDPDAPTGSGWWHWQVVNIPVSTTSLKKGYSIEEGSNQSKPYLMAENVNDYGIKGYGGACPPRHNGAHRYQFTVYALSEMLNLPPNPSGALVGYMVKSHSLGAATIEALYRRN